MLQSRACSVTLPLLLLVERLGVEGAHRGRNAGKNREGNQGGNDGLHGCSSICEIDVVDTMSPFIDEEEHSLVAVSQA